ncbi:hypothetical protein L0F63_004628, partial [Massospora cicadina]
TMPATVKPHWELYNVMAPVLQEDIPLLQIVNYLWRFSATFNPPNGDWKPSVAAAGGSSVSGQHLLTYTPQKALSQVTICHPTRDQLRII